MFSHVHIHAHYVHACNGHFVVGSGFGKSGDFCREIGYKKSMTLNNDPLSYAEILANIDAKVLGARLEVARLRKYESAALAISAIGGEERINVGSYYTHERGERRPKMSKLRVYARVFDVPLEYLLFGAHGEIYETEARALAARASIVLRIDRLDDDYEAESTLSLVPINQPSELVESNTIHNPLARFIVILTASEIRKLSTGKGDLAAMSGPMLPVPDFLNASRRSFGYRVPPREMSMTAPEGLSFSPGGIAVIDPDASIAPGKYVLVDPSGFDEPVIRQYVASRPYVPGAAGYELHALNPSVRPLLIEQAGDCRIIGRVIFFGNEL